MEFIKTDIEGAYLIHLQTKDDDRGFFARSYCQEEFKQVGLLDNIVQANNSFNKVKGTLRGIHFQRNPKEENKLVRCISGTIWDVVVDLRKESSSFGKWYGAELSQMNRHMLLVPEGCGHGYITLNDSAEVLYFVTEYYSPENEGGIRWDDPYFKIKWPMQPSVISQRDRNYPDFYYNANKLE